MRIKNLVLAIGILFLFSKIIYAKAPSLPSSPPTITISQTIPTGFISRWIPENNDDSNAITDDQILLNKGYVSLRIVSAYVYYRSSFLDNVNRFLVDSNVVLYRGADSSTGVMINADQQKENTNGEWIGVVGKYLLSEVPTNFNSINLSINYNGVGSDVFKPIFDTLSSANNLSIFSGGIWTGVNTIAPLVQGFLATPYTTSNPRQVLNMSQSYNIYPNQNSDKYALRTGYYVYMANHNNGQTEDDQFNEFENLDSSDLRVSNSGILQYSKDDGNTWSNFTDDAYVVFYLTKTRFIGEIGNATWSQKYQAIETDINKFTGDPSSSVTDYNTLYSQVLSDWKQANVLLNLDNSITNEEKTYIEANEWNKVNNDLGPSPGVTVSIPAPERDLAQYVSLATEYNSSLSPVTLVVNNLPNSNPGQPVTLQVVDPSTNAPVTTIPTDGTSTAVTISGVRPGLTSLVVENNDNVENSGGDNMAMPLKNPSLFEDNVSKFVAEPGTTKSIDAKDIYDQGIK